MSNDITAVFYSAGVVSSKFYENTHYQLIKALGDIPLIEVHLDDPSKRSHFQIYRQALEGAKKATTKYIALCEDDVLYSPEHFNYRPKKAPFAYNLGYWGIYTWQDPPMYNYKGRRNLDSLICYREIFIEAMEERFAKYPNNEANKDVWAEPGRYESQLGVTPYQTEVFYSQPPNIKFSHPTELSFGALGTRKRAGELRAYDIPFWGTAYELRKLYE